MDYRDTLSADLPAPRDDEPAGVRDDIVDELADHLACAHNRELLCGADANEAQRRVFERFGNPAAVARRLWFDAMGGKIMARRVLLATCLLCVVVSLVSLSLAGALWTQNNRLQRESARATLRALVLQNAQAQKGQEELAKQLKAISEEIQSTRSLDWNPVTFRLSEETPEGPPAVGFSVTLTENVTVAATTAMSSTRQSADRSGIVHFGLVHPGSYAFVVQKSWDRGTALLSEQFFVEPGSKVKKTIVCPKLPLDLVPVRIETNWPADLEKEGLVLHATFKLMPFQSNGSRWFFQEPAPRANYQGQFTGIAPINRSALCGPGSSMTDVLNSTRLYLWGLPEGNLSADLLASDLRELKAPEEPLQWEQGSYQLSALFVLRTRPSGDGERLRQFDVVAALPMVENQGVTELAYVFRQDAPTEEDVSQGSGRSLTTMRNAPVLEVPKEFGTKSARAFEARPAQVNTWTLALPDKLIAAVRESLKGVR